MNSNKKEKLILPLIVPSLSIMRVSPCRFVICLVGWGCAYGLRATNRTAFCPQGYQVFLPFFPRPVFLIPTYQPKCANRLLKILKTCVINQNNESPYALYFPSNNIFISFYLPQICEVMTFGTFNKYCRFIRWVRFCV